MKKIFAFTFPMILLVSCATGYHPMMLNGGFQDFKLANDTYMVKFRGNGFTSQDRAFTFALRRSAELAKENGYRYFKIVNSSSTINISSYRTPIRANTTSMSSGSIYGNYGYGQYSAYGHSQTNATTTISGGDIQTIERPITFITIKLYNKKSNGLIDADTILSNFIENKK